MEQTASADLLFDIGDEVVFEHATKGQRLVNFLIDTIVYWIVAAVCGIIFSFIYFSSYITEYGYTDPAVTNRFTILLYVVFYIVYVVYFTMLEGILKGRTIGKYVSGTIAMNEDGTTLTWKKAFLRSLVRIIPFEPLIAIFTSYPWHDDFTSTVVVKKQA